MMSYQKETIDDLCINAIRFLSIDMVEKAKSGHPGTPMGAAPIVYVLFDKFLKHNPLDPKWPGRDRFVLSAGHACAMLYSLLYLTGYDLTLDDLKQFRQWGSRTPGHLEYGLTPGVEATTGPLGQGFGNAIGMAISRERLARIYNRPGFNLFDHYIYAFVSDGDMEEGISSEAASLAGTLKLGNLIYLYDDNGVSIEGDTDVAFTEDVGKRFRAYGWNVIGPIDGMDATSIYAAIESAKAANDRPNLIICRTVIGYGSPNKAGKGVVHGEPLGEEEAKLTRERLGWSYEPFFIPPDVLNHFRKAIDRGKQWQREWENKLAEYRKTYPREAGQLEQDLGGKLPDGWDSELNSIFTNDTKPISTRAASGRVMNTVAKKVHSITGGAADLAPSTRTTLTSRFAGFEENIDPNMHFGVREHSMGAIANGMALYGGVIPYTGTFLIFYDYMRPPVRMAALMGIRVIFIFTHDSIGLGQDGPTHQPIEHLMGLRAIPNMVTIRPADAHETAEAWRIAMERQGPTALVLTRQDLPLIDRKEYASADGVRRGGYILWEASPDPDIILIGTGSEVNIVLAAGKKLLEWNINARVVSLPSWELFNAQPETYRHIVLPPDVRTRLSVEAASTVGWERYVGLDGVIIGISRFGASAPGEVIYEKLGLTIENVAEKAAALVNKNKKYYAY